MDTVTHEAPAMSLADMPTTDEGTADFRRLAGQRLNAAMKMAVEGLGGRAPERLPRAQAQDRRRRDQAQDPQAQGGGHFHDEVLRPYSRTDRAMVGAIAKVYKLGLSTRKIERAAAYVHTMPRISCPRIPSAAACCRVIMLQTHLYCISSDGSADAWQLQGAHQEQSR